MEKGRSLQVKLLEELQFDAYGVASLRASGLEEKNVKECYEKHHPGSKPLKKDRKYPVRLRKLISEAKGVKKA
jgi:hypothetical protein